MLSDLALSTGAEFIARDSEVGLRDIQLQHFGQCRSIDISRSLTTVIGGKGNFAQIDRRIEILKASLGDTDDLGECDKIQERITKLASGVAVIHVGAPTEVEMTEKKHRIEDALEAVKAAQEEGIVPGGGVALLRAATTLTTVEVENEDQEFGVEILRKACSAPIRQMATNAGLSPDIIESQVRNAPENCGYNFRDFSLVDMLEAGIIDPVKVTRGALENAASAAGILITTSHAIVEV